MSVSIRRASLGILVPAALLAAVPTTPAHAAKAKSLVGTFKIKAGSFSGGKAGGSYFRMGFPGGANFFENPSSTASDKTFTLVTAGTDGGLITGRYQGEPAEKFDATGNSNAGAIIQPTGFANIRFGLATLKAEASSSPASSAVPSVSLKGSKLTAKLSALTATWNKLYFNQGSPKPGSRTPLATGTYNKKTKAYKLDWRSTISGGPFNGFTGIWHLEGAFKGKIK